MRENLLMQTPSQRIAETDRNKVYLTPAPFTHMGKVRMELGGVLVITNKDLSEHTHYGGHRGSRLSATAL